MKQIRKFSLLFAAIMLLSSCGILTRTRYGNGLKLNLGSGLKKEQPSTASVKKEKKTAKLQFRPVFEESIPDQVSDTFKTEAAGTSGLMKQNEKSKPRKLPVAKGSRFEKYLAKSQKHREKEAETMSPGVRDYRAPMEPNVKIGAILFYGSLIGSYLIQVTSDIATVLGPLMGLAMLIGFILAWIGLSNIRDSGGAYRGKGVAISIIVLFILGILYILLVLLFFIAFFGGL